jgi:hypothetical protein
MSCAIKLGPSFLKRPWKLDDKYRKITAAGKE